MTPLAPVLSVSLSPYPARQRLRHGDLSGEIVARYRPARQHSMNEVQKCTGDPAVEANWQHAGMFGGGKATLGSLTPGALVWLRVRTCGLKGVMGAWSDPARHGWCKGRQMPEANWQTQPLPQPEASPCRDCKSTPELE